MPPSRIRREHCRPIKRIPMNFGKSPHPYKILIDEYYAKIIKVLSLGKEPSRTINKRYGHPAGKKCGYDRSTPRYWWLNFIPAVFNLKGKGNETIEFRMHSGTLSFEKIKNWILICMAILSYAENNKHEIIKRDNITLEEILKASFKGKGSYLFNYIEHCKALFNGSDKDACKFNEEKEYMQRISSVFNSQASIKEVIEL